MVLLCLKVEYCISVMLVWRENDPETQITSDQDMEKGRVALAQVFVLDRWNGRKVN
jgi:hypothetical protein